MADYKINVGNDLFPHLMSEGNGLAKLVEAVLNQVLEAQMSEHLGAALQERTEEHQGYRNGSRVRTLWAGDAAGTPGARREFLVRPPQALPALGTGLGADAHGEFLVLA